MEGQGGDDSGLLALLSQSSSLEAFLSKVLPVSGTPSSHNQRAAQGLP